MVILRDALDISCVPGIPFLTSIGKGPTIFTLEIKVNPVW